MTALSMEQFRTDDVRSGVGVGALRMLPSAVLPGDPGWEEARRPWNLAVDQQPVAVAFPESAEEVAAVVCLAGENGLRVAPQGTGHGAVPAGGLEDTVLLVTSRMTDVSVDPVSARARVQAGARWEQVVPPASALGLAALHGSSPDVGVTGYSLGGGIGWLARRYGLASNSITAIELVTAAGEQVRAHRDLEPDLFWALRGGGGNFGIVTALELALYPLEQVYAGWLIWPWEHAHEVLSRWSEWTDGLPHEVTSVGRILQLPSLPTIPLPLRGRRIVAVEAACLTDEDTGRALISPLRELRPELDTFALVPPEGLCRLHQDPEDPTPIVGEHALFEQLPQAAVDAFVGVAGPESDSPFLSAEIRHLGGALRTPPPDAGALSHLDAGYLSLFLGIPEDADTARGLEAHARTIADSLAPSALPVEYLNFAMAPTDARRAYTDDAYRRLQAIRAHVDPECRLHASHGIALPEC